jgi:hypothetical protein
LPEQTATAASSSPAAVSHAAPPKGLVGTAHPVLVQAAAADGSWVIACQARRDTNKDGSIGVNVGYHGDIYGDDMVAYFIRGKGEGVPIDAFVAADPTGRYAVIARGKALFLVDDKGETALSDADASDDANPLSSHRAASFDRAGRRLLYFKGGKVVVRDLASGREMRIDPGPGLVWRAWLEPSGKHVWLRIVVRDSDGDGKLSVPEANTTLGARHCRGPVSVYGVYGWHGDQPVTKLAAVHDGATAREVAAPVGLLNDAIVRQKGDALVVEERGRDRELAPAACHAEVVGIVDDRLYYLCNTGGQKRAKLHLYQKGKSKELAVELEPRGEAVWDTDQLVWAEGGRVLNLATGVIASLARANVYAVEGNAVLTASGIVDLAKGRTAGVPVKLAEYPAVEQRKELVAIELKDGNTAVVNLFSRALLGTVKGKPLAIADSGHVLVSTFTGTETRIGNGPLEWRAPVRP